MKQTMKARKNYEKRRLDIISSNFRYVIITSIITSGILVFNDIHHPSFTYKIYWLVTMMLILSGRIILQKYIKTTERKKLNLYFIGVVCNALVWAIFPFLFHDCSLSRNLYLVIFSGIIGGGATMLAADIRASLSYVTLVILPYCIFLLSCANHDDVIIALLGIIFWISMCISAFRYSRAILLSISNQVALDELIDDMELEIQQRTNKIIRLQQKDKLTQLFNRDSFLSGVEENAGYSLHRIKAVLFLDMNGFKKINDVYGHTFGDYVLMTIGQRISEFEQRYHALSCRWGGDEFLVYFHASSSDSVMKKINLLIQSLSECIVMDNFNITPRFRVGLYHTSEPLNISQAIKSADLAMYEGKRSGQTISVFNDEMYKRQKREEYLRDALEVSIKHEDFYLHFQPIVNTATNNVACFEALLRWDLDNEPVSPEEFIRIAEKYGLINQLGNYVLEKSIASLSYINEVNPEIALSINVSVIQLEKEHFIKKLIHLIQKYHVKSGNIHLEITETVMIDNISKIADIVSEIKELGIMISIDDFGTGFSSIPLLKKLNIDFIKIDKSYIDFICHNKQDESIVSAVTKMSHITGCKVIAEGVEELKQLLLIKKMKIDKYQGYLYSEPVDLETALQYI